MKNFWNNERHTFHRLPDQGKFEVKHFLLAAVFIITMFLGVGQVPITLEVIANRELLSYDQLETMHNLGAFIGKNYLLFLILIPFVLTFFAVLFSIKWIHKTKILPFFTTRSSFDWNRVFHSFTIWFLLAVLTLAYSMYQTDYILWNFNPSTFFGLCAMALALIPIQIACEEILFRSYLFKSLSFLGNPILQLAICGSLFGLMHMGNPEIGKLGQIAIIYYIWTGIFLGLIAHFDNGLELTIGYHFANNIFAAIVLTTNWQAFQTDALFMDTTPPVLGWEIFLSLFLFQPLFLFYFNKKYKWGVSFKNLK